MAALIDGREALSMSEDRGAGSLERRLLALMADMGLWGYHAPDSRRAEPGWPDWVIVGPRGFMFRELKAERGRVTPDQRRVGNILLKAGADWAVWKPSDLLGGVIAEQLSGLTNHPTGRRHGRNVQIDELRPT